jgi:hypothetical protein
MRAPSAKGRLLLLVGRGIGSIRICSNLLEHRDYCHGRQGLSPSFGPSPSLCGSGVYPFRVAPTEVCRSRVLAMFYVVAFAGEVSELGEAPGALVGDPPGQPAGDLGKAEVGAADSPGHGGGGVHVPTAMAVRIVCQ